MSIPTVIPIRVGLSFCKLEILVIINIKKINTNVAVNSMLKAIGRVTQFRFS